VDHNSSRREITNSKLESFVTELANLEGRFAPRVREYGHIRLLLNKFREFFPESFPTESSIARERDELHEVVSAAAITEPRTQEEREQDSLDALIRWNKLLRRAWEERDPQQKFWLLIKLRVDFHETVNPGSQEAPKRTPFEQAMDHLLKVDQEGRAKYCENPDCPAPYFIAGNRLYRFCRPECAEPAQRQHKRNWWNKKGKELRAKGRKRGKR